MSLICPACKKVYMKPQVDPETQLEIDICPKCYGMWFDAEELSEFFHSQSLKEKFLIPESAEPGQGNSYVITTISRSCPRCKEVLSEKLFGDVSLDICQKCNGLWLDDGELKRIIKMYRKGHRSIKEVSEELDKGLSEKEEKHSVSDVVKAFFSFLKKPEKQDL
jgi:Zn-finger nucleic acid-binding protein